jgi:alpha-L-rhamnosidase
MTIRNSRFYLAFFLILVSVSGFAQKQAISEKNNYENQKPNIIFILTDDQRWSALGYAGNESIRTPQMDELAEQGCYFSTAMVTTPICAASRASIFSGLHERTHKYTFQTGEIRTEYMEDSYPLKLREAGYHTGFYGKFGVNYSEKDKLFDEFEDYDRNGRYHDYRGYYYKTLGSDTVHLTRYTGQKALDFIEDAPSDKPFSLSLCFSAPHAHDGAPLQYFWQEEPGRLYQDMEMPEAELGDDKYFDALPKPVRDGFNRLRWTWRYDTPEKYQHSVKGYYRMIYGIDLEIAKIREKLIETGQDKNTVIILMGDNGQFLGERQMAGKWLMYDNSVRVPLIIYDPREGKHLDIDEMALNIDIPATMLDMAGISRPSTWQGESLLPLVTGKDRSLHRDTVLIEHLWEFENIPPSEGVRTKEWKYFRYINDKSIEELYHLSSDPKEINNLAANPDYKDLLMEFRAKNDQLGQRFPDPYSGIPNALTVEFIRDPQLTKIMDSRPEFNWVVPKEAVTQKAYQVLVSSKRELAQMNIGDVWNSGQVRSSKSSNIEFEGDLEPNTKYFWRVRIFDKDNRLSEYSEIQEFTTGEFGESLTTDNIILSESLSPQTFYKNSDGSYFADFGKDAFAALILEIHVTKKKNITVRFGEKLLEGKIDQNPGGTIRYQEVELTILPKKDSYLIPLKADGRNTKPAAISLPESFPVIMPFRYVEIEGVEKLNSDNLTQQVYFNYFDESTSSFSSSNDILNQVWNLCKYSIKATAFSSYYVDGDRERIPYEADAYINQLSHYGVDNEYAIARRTIEYLMNNPTWPTEWQLHMALMVYADYMYTGNTELIEKYYEQLKVKSLMSLANEQELISTKSPNHNAELMANLGFSDTTNRLRDIVDWPQKGGFGGVIGEIDDFEFMPINTVINSFYYRNMVILSEFAELLGKTDEALDFNFRAMKCKHAINNELFNKELGFYVDGQGSEHASVHANMLPLAFDIVPQAYKTKVAAYVKSRGMACSVYGAQYLMEALYNANEADYALELLSSTDKRSWFNMIKSGSTITMEAWDMEYKPNSDWNHAWGAVPANIIPRGLWGIKPLTPGFGLVSFKPQMGKLKRSTIIQPTIKGQIKAEYIRKSARLTSCKIELPANMAGEILMEFDKNVVVSLNGKDVNLAFGSIRLTPGINQIEIKTNSF